MSGFYEHNERKGYRRNVKDTVFWRVTPCRLVVRNIHGITSRKTAIFITTVATEMKLPFQ